MMKQWRLWKLKQILVLIRPFSKFMYICWQSLILNIVLVIFTVHLWFVWVFVRRWNLKQVKKFLLKQSIHSSISPPSRCCSSLLFVEQFREIATESNKTISIYLICSWPERILFVTQIDSLIQQFLWSGSEKILLWVSIVEQNKVQ